MDILNYLDARSDKEREEAKNITSETFTNCNELEWTVIPKSKDHKLDALYKLVELLIIDRYSSPGSGHIFNESVAQLLKDLRSEQNDR